MGAAQKAIRLAGPLQLSLGSLLLLSAPAMAADEPVYRLKEITVTGTRLDLAPGQESQELQVYTAEDISNSGQPSLSEFLNTLPVVSSIVDPAGLQTDNGVTGVRLHGLALGATLVLIDGKRIGVSAGGAFNDIFDLSNIPLPAIERVEILPQGSSAIYGSDAIAGVVNVILKRNFEGVAVSGRYGGADHTQEGNGSLAWGMHSNHGSASVIASYQMRSQLLGRFRELSSNADLTPSRLLDGRFTIGNPGNVFSTNGANLPGLNAPFAAVPAGFTGTPSIAEFATTAGQLNTLNAFSDVGLIPRIHSASFLGNGSYDLTDDIKLELRLLYTHNEHDQALGPAAFSPASPAFQTFTVPAANPFNPFGTTVGIGYVFPGVTQNTYHNDFFLPGIGIKGTLGDRWKWEVAGWASLERERITVTNEANAAAIQAALNSANPATALNPFIAGAPGSQDLVNSVLFTDDQRYASNTFSTSALLRGSPVTLPSGDISVAVGAEFDFTTLDIRDAAGAGNPIGLGTPSVSRHNYAFFGEARIPLIGPLLDPANDLLAITGAERYDRYSDFGGHATSQAGAVLRPLPAFSLSANWGQAFKAPSLFELNLARNSFLDAIIDPQTGTGVGATVTTGGNPALKPLTGESHSFTAVYADGIIPGLGMSVSNWAVRESNSIQLLNPQIIVDNEGAFPGAVTRASSCAGGPPCPITAVNSTFVNFGTIDIAGIDYLLNYRFSAGGITWRPEVSATQTYRYKASLQPGQAATNRVSAANDDFNWAPRWKGRLALAASQGAWSAGVAGRYVGPYRDYDPQANGTFLNLGKLWYVDANFRYSLGGLRGETIPWPGTITISLGAVNLFDQKPQHSNVLQGAIGFDLLQADMRGRFVYLQVDAKW